MDPVVGGERETTLPSPLPEGTGATRHPDPACLPDLASAGALDEDARRLEERARLRSEISERVSRLGKWPEPYWAKVDCAKYEKDEEGLKMVEHARRLGKAVREGLLRYKKLDTEPLGQKVLSESQKTEEVTPPCDAGRFQHAEELEPPCKEYATPRPRPTPDTMDVDEETSRLGHSTEDIQGEAKRGCSHQLGLMNCTEPYCANNPQVEYCMSDQFIEILDRNAKLYFRSRKELSRKEIIANGFNFMDEEAFLAFRNYIAEKDLFEDFDYKFGELLHHCFSFEGHRKVYCHYNFTIEMKKNEECWTSRLYFAEAKWVHGIKHYFCSPLEKTDDGRCYLCMNQGVNALKHPPGGGYEIGHEGSESCYPNADSDSDNDECGDPMHLFS